MMGIGKRALLEEYYVDELAALMKEWAALHGGEEEAAERISAAAFLGEDGEWIG